MCVDVECGGRPRTGFKKFDGRNCVSDALRSSQRQRRNDVITGTPLAVLPVADACKAAVADWLAATTVQK